MKNIICILFSMGMLMTGCINEPHYRYLEDIPYSEYYSMDIVPDSLQKLYGKWNLISTSGGFSGGGNGKEFEYLVFKKNGIFGVLKGNSLIAYGKITFTHKPHTTTLTFIPVKSADIDLCTDSEKSIWFTGFDTLTLYAPCCDRYNMHLVRKSDTE
jgi:hypothetical protein